MIFITFEPYEEEIVIESKCNENSEDIICFICYECYDDIGKLPIKLKENVYYIKDCKCDSFIHKSCLDKWFALNSSCPICRNSLYKNELYNFYVLDYYSEFILVNELNIYIFDTNKIIHFLYILKRLFYILDFILTCVRIYIYMSLLYLLIFFFIVFIRDRFL